MSDHYTITESDIGARTIRAFGRVWLTANFLGRILPTDVGKRVYRASADHVAVENDDQLAARTDR